MHRRARQALVIYFPSSARNRTSTYRRWVTSRPCRGAHDHSSRLSTPASSPGRLCQRYCLTILVVVHPGVRQTRVVRSVALKVKESAANEHPTISCPARDARDVLKEAAANQEESSVGLLSRVRPNGVVDEQRMQGLQVSVGDCDSESRLVEKYVDIGARRTVCNGFPTIAPVSLIDQNVIAYSAACQSWGDEMPYKKLDHW